MITFFADPWLSEESSWDHGEVAILDELLRDAPDPTGVASASAEGLSIPRVHSRSDSELVHSGLSAENFARASERSSWKVNINE